MFNFLQNFNNDNLSKFKEQVKKINSLETEISSLDENGIKERINSLIQCYKIEKNFDSILCESFALTREASKRTIGLRHFDTQLMGGIVLHNGNIAEMKTGEGKTLVATLAVVLNALALKGVHVVTVNEYLAKRDKQWMSQLYRYLGLSVGLIEEKMDSDERRKNYSADITYVTNSELAFDYLRDNMASSVNDLVLRDFNYCIIDEVDSILIDEARTPLIISGMVEGPLEKYITSDEIAKYLKPNIDYLVDEKNKNITLTSDGIKQTEKLLNIDSLYNLDDPWIPYINNALKSKILFLKDINYIVKNDEIIIVDEFTGRVMNERRWSDGLHQAIEAKEGVPIKKGSETLCSITYQNFFLSYPKFGGMTGTAKTAEAELEKIYQQKVIVLPTAKENIRKDLPDLVYKDEFTKWQAIAKETSDFYLSGRPVLIGTTSIEKSEIISELLKIKGVSHRLLNAKPENIKLESVIIAQAGCKGAVTVSTNMAGRGTDILLGGNPDFLTRQSIFQFFYYGKSSIKNRTTLSSESSKILILEKKLICKKVICIYKKFGLSLNDFLLTSNKLKYYDQQQLESLILNLRENGHINIKKPIDIFLNTLYEYYYEKFKKQCDQEKLIVQNLGGLYVIGTERHESRRIDNQLRGRAGRQGDPGTSRFFISLDDNLFRIFGGDQIKKMMNQLQLSDDTPLEASFLTTTLDKAQTKVEDYFYDSRKRLFDYDQVINSQRIAIYRERRALLTYSSVRPEMIVYGEDLIYALIRELTKLKKEQNRLKFHKLNKEISYLLEVPYLFLNYDEINENNLQDLTFSLLQTFWLRYDLKETEFESILPGFIRAIEKISLLDEIDNAWKRHLQKADLLKETIGWRSYGQLDPLREYKKEGFNLFLDTIREIKYNSVYETLTSYFKI